jgi:hypothetical protein
MREDFDVIVVGGGLAGLAAGATAVAGGASTLVLDAHEPGGRSRTTERDGFVFNMGAHALYVGGPGMRVLRSLGVQPDGTPPPLRRYKLLAGGTLHLLPTGPGTLLRTTALGRRSKAQLGRLLGLLPRMDAAKLAGQSVDDWLGAHGLRPDAEAVVRAIIRLGTYVADMAELGADAAVVQLQAGASSGVLYLHGGWSGLVDGLRARVQVRPHHPVRRLEPAAGRVEVQVDTGGCDGGALVTARAVVLAPGTPDAARALLAGAGDPGWGDLGDPVTAACLDVGAARVPEPGYVLSADEPLYGSTQGPPARQAPDGRAAVGVIRYGARSAAEDRPQLERHLREVGVGQGDVVCERFLARMVVTGGLPRAANGGLGGRPAVTATGMPGVLLAGDWVGLEGLLADASLSSGQAAARVALRALERGPAPAPAA